MAFLFRTPLQGTGFGLQLSANSIEEMEVITGGFNAEYWSGNFRYCNVKTREGGIGIEGYVSYKRDRFWKIRNHIMF